MKLSPLDLCRYVVTEMSCTANPSFDPKKPIGMIVDQMLVDSSVDKMDAEVPERKGWAIELRVAYQNVSEQNYPYEYAIVLMGFFTSPAEVPEGLDDKRLVNVNGCSMLYGIAREQIRSATAIGPWGEILLPTVSFREETTEADKIGK